MLTPEKVIRLPLHMAYEKMAREGSLYPLVQEAVAITKAHGKETTRGRGKMTAFASCIKYWAWEPVSAFWSSAARLAVVHALPN